MAKKGRGPTVSSGVDFSGCVRLINDHMIDLYDRVPVGTPVFVS